MDGGVKADNVAEVVRRGARVVVAGSAIFVGGAGHPRQHGRPPRRDRPGDLLMYRRDSESCTSRTLTPMAWTLYRIIVRGRAPPLDFTSRAAQGVPPRSHALNVRLWDGISCWATEAQARRIAQVSKAGTYIAVLHIPDGARLTSNGRVARATTPCEAIPGETMTYVIEVR